MTEVSSRGRWLALIAAFLGWLFDGFEMGIFALVARPALHDLLGDIPEDVLGQWYAVATAAFLLGAAAGGVLFGWLGDRMGRARAMMLSILVYSLLTGACGLATSPEMLVTFRFLAALGMGGEWALGVALVMEVWPNRSRAWVAGVVGTAVNVGFMLVALVSVGLAKWPDDLRSLLLSFNLTESTVNYLTARSAWRLLLFCGAVPALLVVPIRWLVPESARWAAAAARQRSTETAGDNSPSGWSRRRLLKNLILGAALAAIPLLGTWGSIQWIPLWAHKMTAGFVGSATGWTQFASGTGGFLGTVVAALLGGWLGRRWAYVVLCILALASTQILFLCFAEYSLSFLIMTGVVGFCVGSFYGWLPLYLPELYPTAMRALGQGFAYNFGRVIAAVGTLQMATLLGWFDQSYPRACAALSWIFALGLVLIWFAPETKGEPLPD